MSENSNDSVTIDELADRVDCLAKNVSRILQLLSRDNTRKEDEKHRRREKCWA